MITPKELMKKVEARKLEIDNQFEQKYLEQKDAMESQLEELLIDSIARGGKGVWLDEYNDRLLYDFLCEYGNRVYEYRIQFDEDDSSSMCVTPIFDDDSWNEY